MELLSNVNLLNNTEPLSMTETSMFFNYFLADIYDFGTRES